MDTRNTHELENRVLFVAPTKRDATVTCSLLESAGIVCHTCHDLHELAREVDAGCGAILLTEEAVASSEIAALLATMRRQPSWSDPPVVLLMRGGTPSAKAADALRSLSNVTLLERPAPTRSVISAVSSAVRGRQRQYQIRDQIESLRRAEITSTELRRQLEVAVDASALGTFHCAFPLDRIDWNERCKQHFFLPPDAEVDFDLFYSLLHPDDRQRTRHAVEACVFGRTIYDVEYRVLSPEGQVRWIRATGRTAYDEQGHPIQFDGTTHDITDRKRSEEELKEADRRKNEFLAMLAHELRNPLAPVRNALQIIRMADGDKQAVRTATDIMERQVGQMVRLIDDLIDVSRVSRGKIELRMGVVELASIVNHAVEAVGPQCGDRNLELSVAMPSEPIYVDGDPTRLTQIVGNLLNNACKFTDDRGHVWLTVERDGKHAVIRVRDDGVGIAADDLARIFDMFVQVDTSLERSVSGLGIGLTLVKSLVELHHGSLEVHSAGIGYGTEFVVRLPISTTVRESLVDPSPRRPHSAETSRRILVVDDNQDSADTLARLLRLSGNETRTAFDGLEAVEAAATFRPDIVLLDIGLPKLNGYEACRRIREQPWSNGVIVVALTGWGQEDARQKSKDAGFSGHLVKPINYDALMRLLDELGQMPASKSPR